MTGAAGVVVLTALQVVAGDNLRTLQPNRSFRAGQMSRQRLESVIRDRGIRTVINLRGYCPDFEWYRDECRATHASNVAQEDITLSAIRLPTPSEIRRLIEVLDRADYPILMHCRQGVDRTGLASTIVKLLEPGVSLGDAQRQLSLAYGYVPFNGTENMRRFLSLYREWLQTLDVQHSPELFRHWAMREYCPGVCRADVEFLDLPGEYTAWTPNVGHVVHVRVRNDSIRNWDFRPGTNQGIHARYSVIDASGNVVVSEKAGRYDAVVTPGESLELAVGVPPLAAGRYALTLDMIDADQNAFSQFGVEPAVREFRVGAN
jgi:protein tyrosine phosphatase (PTP) superfamily phosphohydrolase (DUF442 family)